MALMFEYIFKLMVIVALGYAIRQNRRLIKMGQKTDDAITALEGKFQSLGNSILKEVGQLKDAKAKGTDDPAAIARLEALGNAAASFTSDLDADDETATSNP